MFGVSPLIDVLRFKLMEITKLFEWAIAHGGPSFVLACAGIYYMYREKTTAQAENKDLVNQVIDGQEKRINAEHEHRALLKTLIEKNGATTQQMRESFARMEANQLKLMEEIREFKSKH